MNYKEYTKEKFKGEVFYKGHSNLYKECDFEDGCILSGGMNKFENCKFGKNCKFLGYGTRFIGYCYFGEDCYFEGNGGYTFEDECWFDDYCIFIDCAFSKKCCFGDDCEFRYKYLVRHNGCFKPTFLGGDITEDHIAKYAKNKIELEQ